jgi:hypothetical protein
MKIIRILAATAALFVTTGAAAAPSANDARCVVLSNVYASDATDPKAQKVAEASFYFYLGRIGPATAAEIKTMFEQQGKTITDATAGGLMDGCVKEFQARLQLIQSLGSPPRVPQKKP